MSVTMFFLEEILIILPLYFSTGIAVFSDWMRWKYSINWHECILTTSL